MPETEEYARSYFDTSARSNNDYWRRFGDQPDWPGKRVLDLGCGHGAMTIQIAQAGGQVIGIDLNKSRIDFAQRNLQNNFPDLTGLVSFIAGDATSVLDDNEPFDVIVSKDTLEHVDQPCELLRGLGKLLKPNGRLYVGFSPLFYSPFGDHGNAGLRVPWLHAVLPKRLVFAAASRHQGRPVTSLSDITLNGNTPKQFRNAFDKSGLQLIDLRYNRGDKRLLPALERIRKSVRLVEKFTTVSMYAVLSKSN